MSANEYRWEWCKPNKPGVWVRNICGRDLNPEECPDTSRVFDVINPNANPESWWCFLMPLPEILPPKKKSVWRLWILPKYYYGLWSYMPHWLPECQQPSRSDAIRTDKTEEREE